MKTSVESKDLLFPFLDFTFDGKFPFAGSAKTQGSQAQSNCLTMALVVSLGRAAVWTLESSASFHYKSPPGERGRGAL